LDEEEFRLFLKRKGKKPDVVERNILSISKFESFLIKRQNKQLDDKILVDDLESYVSMIEDEKNASAKGPLYVLMNYFRFLDNNALYQATRKLREERTKKSRRIFLLKDFLDVDLKVVKKLASIGITNVEEMLEAGAKKKQRIDLVRRLEIPEEKILELVKLSDITRIGYVKRKLARLYYNAGLDSPEKIAKFEPEELHAFFVKFVEESNWDGMVPNPMDLVNNIKSARKTTPIVEE